MKKFLLLTSVFVLALGATCVYYSWDSHLSWNDFVTFNSQPVPVGVLAGDPLQRLAVKPTELREQGSSDPVRFLGKSRYLNDARAVVTHTIDDTTRYVPQCLDTLDKYGIKATVFVNTGDGLISDFWPRLRQAIANGHEIGSHSRRHQCQWPDAFLFCFRAYTDYEVTGSRDDILKHTGQPYVWSWCYPCGNCAEQEFVQRKLARAGYIVARPYPGEAQDQHILPDLQTYSSNPYYALYTQVVQKKGGIARSGRTNVPELNAKFDEVYLRRGIYNFLSHPQWLDYGPEKFYEQHLAHVAGHKDIWYVPMGPLYAYRTVRQETHVRSLEPAGALARFAVFNSLDPKVFTNSITLEFSYPRNARNLTILANGQPVIERTEGLADRWDTEYYRREGDKIFVTVRANTILEFR